MSFLQYDPTPMTEAEAEVLLSQTTRFDYLKGRVMKISLEGDELNPSGYDRNNGEGSAMLAILELGATGETNSARHQAIHDDATRKSLSQTEKVIQSDHSYVDGENFHLGLSDMADLLTPALDRAKKK